MTLPRQVKLDVLPQDAQYRSPTPDLTFSPASTPSLPQSVEQHKRRPGTPTPERLNSKSCASSFGATSAFFEKHDVAASQSQTASVRQRLRQPFEPEERSEINVAANHESMNVSNFGPTIEPTFVKELSDFLASRAGKDILPSRIIRAKDRAGPGIVVASGECEVATSRWQNDQGPGRNQDRCCTDCETTLEAQDRVGGWYGETDMKLFIG